MASSIFIDPSSGFASSGGSITTSGPLVLPPGLDLQFGGTTASFPALKQTSAFLTLRLADDSAQTKLAVSALVAGSESFPAAGVIAATAGLRNAVTGSDIVIMTAPTISSGFGTTPSIANSNGTASFIVNVGTGGTATAGVIGLPAATTGWNCYVTDLTAAAGHTGLRTYQTASTTNSVTVESQNSAGAATAWATGSLLRVSCFGF